jgi:hypothetical protein
MQQSTERKQDPAVFTAAQRLFVKKLFADIDTAFSIVAEVGSWFQLMMRDKARAGITTFDCDEFEARISAMEKTAHAAWLTSLRLQKKLGLLDEVGQ